MSNAHVETLLFRRRKIKSEIEREQAARNPDRMRLMALKKLRLAIKDRLHRLALASTPQPIRVHRAARKLSTDL